MKPHICENGFPSFKSSNFMLAILRKLSILFINYQYISCDVDNTKILYTSVSVRYLVVKTTCVNAALIVDTDISKAVY